MEHGTNNRFHDILKKKMDEYVHLIYKLTKNFPKLETSYASLKESKYLLHFSLIEKYVTTEEYKKAWSLSEEIGAMLWTTIRGMSKK